MVDVQVLQARRVVEWHGVEAPYPGHPRPAVTVIAVREDVCPYSSPWTSASKVEAPRVRPQDVGTVATIVQESYNDRDDGYSRTMSGRARVAVALAAAAALAAPGPAVAAPLERCGEVGGWTVKADGETTTCGLARSAARDFLRRLADGDGAPDEIVGTSRKTDKPYRLTRRSSVTRPSKSIHTYLGRAGEAALRVRIIGHLN